MQKRSREKRTIVHFSNHQARQRSKSAAPESCVAILPEKRRDTIYSGRVVGGDEASCETRARLFPTRTMNNQPRSIKLFCWILDKSTRSFSIYIDDSQTVDDLKKVIVKENPNTFVNVDAFLLELRKVSGIFNFNWTTFLTLL